LTPKFTSRPAVGGHEVIVKKMPYSHNGRALILGEPDGMVKIIAEKDPTTGTGGRILGVHMAGPWVTEQLGQGYLAVNWEATVDGRPAEILKADYLLRAVPVPAGTHRVEFHFRPRAMRQGLLLSCASLVVTLGLLGAGLLRRRPAAAPAAGGA